MKIFEFNKGQSGTKIESVSNTAINSTNPFHKTQKGMAMQFNINSQFTKSLSLNGTYTLRMWVKFNSSVLQYLFTDVVAPLNYRVYVSNGNIASTETSTKYVNNVLANAVLPGKWYEILFTDYALVSSSFAFGAYYTPGGGANGLIGDVAKFEIYDETPTASQRNEFYKEFLNSYGTEKPIRGFELVKPTDLSYQKDRGLLAAYNMKPNGSTLVDISGNGNNGTLDSGVVVENNQIYIPHLKQISFSGVTLPTSQNSICWRGLIKGIPGSYARIFSTYGVFTSNMGSFLLKSSSDPVVTFSTGLTTSAFNQDFDFVITRNGNTFKMYINGNLVATDTVDSPTPQVITTLGSNSIETTSAYINHRDFRLYDRELSLQEIKDYHNSFIKPIILEDWSGSAVSDVI